MNLTHTQSSMFLRMLCSFIGRYFPFPTKEFNFQMEKETQRLYRVFQNGIKRLCYARHTHKGF